jgi:pimeloyl-ACP methyl ester carboxylesterase
MSTCSVLIGLLLMSIAAHVAFAAIALRWNPPIGEFIHVAGVRLHYVERGPPDGAVLVMLHGNGATVHDMIIAGLVDLAAAKYRVLCFDRPGFGHSSRPRLRLWTPAAQAALFAEALQQLKVERPVVLGHSWAASVAIAMGLLPAVNAKGLVLISGYYFPTWRFDVWSLTGPAIPLLGDLARYTIASLVSWAVFPPLLRKLFAPETVPDSYEQFPRSLALRPLALRSAAEECAMMVPCAAAAMSTYAQLRRPVAIIAGDADRIVEREQAGQLHAVLPRSVLNMISEKGHMVHHASPDRVYDAVQLISAWPAVL